MSPDVIAFEPIALRTQEHHKAIRSISLAVLICWLVTIVLGLLSDGVHHDDDLVHFLMARWSWWYPGYLLHVWGRSGLTVPMAAVTWIPEVETAWHAARILSSTVSAAAALIAARLALRIGIERPWRVVLACYLQPLFTVLGFTTLTENFTALYLIGGVALLDRGRSILASAVFSLALLTRHEAVMFVPIWLVALYWRRTSSREFLFAALASLWAPVVHNVLFRWTLGDWPVRIFFQPSGSTLYLPTGWGAYIPDALYAMTPAVFVFFMVGTVSLLRSTIQDGINVHRRRAATNGLVVVVPVAFFLVHAIITATGIYGSGGFGRFMVAIAPFAAILAVLGWDKLRAAGSGIEKSRIPWHLMAACWLVIWMACESEWAAGRLPVSDTRILTAGRGIIVVLLLLSTSCLGILKRSQRSNMRFLTLLFLVTCAQVVTMCRPLELKSKQKSVASLIRQLNKAGLEDRPIFAADAWFAYGLGLVENPRAMKDAKLLASLPVGALLIWDNTYSGSDYHGLALADFEQSSSYRERTADVLPADSSAVFRVFEKTGNTPIPEVIRPSYPPPVKNDGRPPVRGVFYVRDRSRPMKFVNRP